jgi:hypothetical protein
MRAVVCGVVMGGVAVGAKGQSAQVAQIQYVEWRADEAEAEAAQCKRALAQREKDLAAGEARAGNAEFVEQLRVLRDITRERLREYQAEAARFRERIPIVKKAVGPVMTGEEIGKAIEGKEVVEMVLVGPVEGLDAAVRAARTELGHDGEAVGDESAGASVGLLRIVADMSGEGRENVLRVVGENKNFKTKWIEVWSEGRDKKLRVEAEKSAAGVVENCGAALKTQVAGAAWQHAEKMGKDELANVKLSFDVLFERNVKGSVKGNVKVFRITPGREWLAEKELDRWAVFPKLGVVATCSVGGGFRQMDQKDVDAMRAAFSEALAPLMRLEKVKVREGGW